jgi:hypothetical protein
LPCVRYDLHPNEPQSGPLERFLIVKTGCKN